MKFIYLVSLLVVLHSSVPGPRLLVASKKSKNNHDDDSATLTQSVYAEFWARMISGGLSKPPTPSDSSDWSRSDAEAEFFGRLGESGVIADTSAGRWLRRSTSKQAKNQKDLRGSGGLKKLFSEEDFFRLLRTSVGKWYLKDVADRLYHSDEYTGIETGIGKKTVEKMDISPLLQNKGNLEMEEDIVLSSPLLSEIDTATKNLFSSLLRSKGPDGNRLDAEEGRQRLKQFLIERNMTIILRDADGRHPVLADLVSYWTARSGGYRVGTSLYWTPAGSISGVGPHIDTMDVLAIQLSGSKTWSYESNCKPLPTPDMVPSVSREVPLPVGEFCGASDTPTKPYFDRSVKQAPKVVPDTNKLPSARRHFSRSNGNTTLKANDLLWLSRGIIHSTKSLAPRQHVRPGEEEVLPGSVDEEGSLHISLGVECSATWTIATIVGTALGHKTVSDAGASFQTKLLAPDVEQIRFIKLVPSSPSPTFSGSKNSNFLVEQLRDQCLPPENFLRLLIREVARLPQMVSLRRSIAPALIPYHDTKTHTKLHKSFNTLQRALGESQEDLEKYFPFPTGEKSKQDASTLKKAEDGLIRWCEFLTGSDGSKEIFSLENLLNTATPVWHQCRPGDGPEQAASQPAPTVYKNAERIQVLMSDLFSGIHCRRLIRGSLTDPRGKKSMGQSHSGRLGDQDTISFIVWTRQEVGLAVQELLLKVQQVPTLDHNYQHSSFQRKIKNPNEQTTGVVQEWVRLVRQWRRLHIELSMRDKLDATSKLDSPSLKWSEKLDQEGEAGSVKITPEVMEANAFIEGFEAWQAANLRLWTHSVEQERKEETGARDTATPKDEL